MKDLFDDLEISVGTPGDLGQVGAGEDFNDDDEDIPCPEDVKMILGFDPDEEPDLVLGGEGSGHFGHAGRLGEVGGSAPGGGGGLLKIVGRPPPQVLWALKRIPAVWTRGVTVRMESSDRGIWYNSKIIHLDSSEAKSFRYSTRQYNVKQQELSKEVLSKSRFMSTTSYPELDSDMKLGREFSNKYIQHIIAHEVGHHVWHQLSEKYQNRLAKQFRNIRTPTVRAYDRYFSDRELETGVGNVPRGMAGRDYRIRSEQFAEAFRQYITTGQHAKIFAEVKTRLMAREEPNLVLGGEGSGHFGHAGRPGEVGGSAPSGSGHIYALAVAPKGAPEPVKKVFHDRQYAYSKMNQAKKAGRIEESRKWEAMYRENDEILKDMKSTNPEWFKKESWENKWGEKRVEARGGVVVKPPEVSAKPLEKLAKPKLYGSRWQDKVEGPVSNLEKEFKSRTDAVSGNVTFFDSGGKVIDKSEIASKAFGGRISASVNTLNHLKNNFGGPFAKEKVKDFSFYDSTILFRGNSSHSGIDPSHGATAYYKPLQDTVHMGLYSYSNSSQSVDRLTIGSFIATAGFRGTVRHEMGHHYYETMRFYPTTEKPHEAFHEWNNIYERYTKEKWEKSVSKYASVKREEAFAECFSVYTRPKYNGELPPEVHQFMNKYFPRRKE